MSSLGEPSRHQQIAASTCALTPFNGEIARPGRRLSPLWRNMRALCVHLSQRPRIFPETTHLSKTRINSKDRASFQKDRACFQKTAHLSKRPGGPRSVVAVQPGPRDATERVPPLGWSHCRSQYRKDTRATLRRGRVPKCLRTRQSASLQQRHLVAAAVRFGRELMAIVRRSSSCFRSAVQGGRVLPRLARQISCFLAASTISPRMKSGGSLALN